MIPVKIPGHPQSRRQFLHRLSIGAAALAAGVALPGALAAQTNALSKLAKGRKKLGVALLGLGRYAANELAPALQCTKLCRLAGAVSGHPAKLKAWSAKYNLPEKNLYTYDTMHRLADNPDIDIVYVVTPPALHPEFSIRAAQAGKHVISEKPMAATVAGCQAMIDACHNAGVRLSIGYRCHFDPYCKELMRLQRDREFGDFMKMSGDRGFVLKNWAWRIDKKLAGGGPLMDLGIYVIQGACMATGLAPVSVTAHEPPKQRPDLFNQVEETIDFTLNFPNGAICNGITSFDHVSDTFRADGDKGWIDFENHAFTYHVGRVMTSRGPLVYPVPGPFDGHYCYQQAWQMDDFADCIHTGRHTPVPGAMGLRDIKIITAIYEASRTGKKITV
ncbi:MAG: Gfo/Idh/MocA family oxidoreductase [Verrucomicrobiota bacterium]|nr:Gfo/Idh/MocA family oxidoreductase [Verrucomicrobiota bacterium]